MSDEGQRTHHPECRVEVGAWESHEAFVCDDAEVWIEAESILISYFDEDGIVVLEGRREAEGWALSARSRPRRAFLRPMAEDPSRYEGEIEEQGESARWTLTLGSQGSR